MDTGLGLTHVLELIAIAIKNSYHNWISYSQKARGKNELSSGRKYFKRLKSKF